MGRAPSAISFSALAANRWASSQTPFLFRARPVDDNLRLAASILPWCDADSLLDSVPHVSWRQLETPGAGS
jgi:hypothetical protein